MGFEVNTVVLLIVALLAIIAGLLVAIWIKLDALDSTVRKAAFVARGDWKDFRMTNE